MDSLENNTTFSEPVQPAPEEEREAPAPNSFWSTPGEPGQEQIHREMPQVEYARPTPAQPAPRPEYAQPTPAQPAPQPEYTRPSPQPEYARPVPQQLPQVPPAPRYQPQAAAAPRYTPREPQTAMPRQPVYQQPYYKNTYAPPAPPVPPAPPRQPPRVPPVAPPAPRAEAPKKKGGFWKGLIATVLILLLVAGSCGGTIFYVNHRWQQKTDAMSADYNNQIGELQDQLDELTTNANTGTTPPDTTPSGTAISVPTGDGMTPAQIYEQNVQSVVAISSTITSSLYGMTSTGTATGSGFIYTSDGYIVTNYHVIDGASAITVTTNSGFSYDATLVGGDENNDVAVLKVEATNLPSVTIGSSDALVVGDQVAAIGNPLGTLTNTLTVGYVSAKNRAVTTDSFAVNMLQTDAAINSGNSGGPLFNMYGQVVGITSAKYSGESSSGATIEGIGFAIPIDDVKDLIEALINDGYVSSGYLGISVSDYVCDSSYASYYGIPESTPTGGIVREVVEGYSAARAGVQLNDVIVAMGDYTVTGVNSLTAALRHYHAGDTTTITVYRNGEKLVLPITLDEKPAE